MSLRVYRNLTRACWSVREGGRVIAHVEEIALADVTFTVQAGGRRRVLQTGQRCVHAWAEGVAVDLPLCPEAWERIGYDPWSAPAFTVRPGFAAVIGAELVAFTASGKAYASGLLMAARPRPAPSEINLGTPLQEITVAIIVDSIGGMRLPTGGGLHGTR